MAAAAASVREAQLTASAASSVRELHAPSGTCDDDPDAGPSQAVALHDVAAMCQPTRRRLHPAADDDESETEASAHNPDAPLSHAQAPCEAPATQVARVRSRTAPAATND